MNWTPIREGGEMPSVNVDVLVTLGKPGCSRRVVVAFVSHQDGEWRAPSNNAGYGWDVIAWAPMPAPWGGE